MASFIKKNKLYFICFVLFAFGLAIQVFIYPKGHLVVLLNSVHTQVLNTFFRYATHIGDGATFVAVSVVLLLFVKIRWGILGLTVFAVSGLVSRILKTAVFGPLPRPHKYYEGTDTLEVIEGVDIAYMYSFPSGHTITSFAMFSLLAFLFYKNPVVAFFCFLLAVMASISRVYLAMHFAEDVLAGSIIGFVSAWLLYYYMAEKKPAFLQKPTLDRPLLKRK